MAKKVYVSELFDLCASNVGDDDCKGCIAEADCIANPWPYSQHAYLLTSQKDYEFNWFTRVEDDARRTYITPSERKNYIMNGAIEITIVEFMKMKPEKETKEPEQEQTTIQFED